MKLFYDDEYDAINQMVAHSEKSPKECACHLRPDLKPDSAYAWFKACCNPQGDQRFRFGHLLALMRFCGQYDLLYYACDELSHARPAIVSQEDELVRLLRRYTEIGQELARLQPRIEKLRAA